MSRPDFRALAAIALVALLCGAAGAPQPPDDNKQLAHDIFKQLIEIHSVHTVGTKEVAEKIAARLIEGGFAPEDVQVLPEEKYPSQVNVVVRLRGKGIAKPILWNGHIDVVEAKAEDWTLPPFALTEKDGVFSWWRQ